LLDWVVFDMEESFFQSPEELQWVMDRAKEANFEMVRAQNEIVVLAKPATTFGR
jgi:hypothetical protein